MTAAAALSRFAPALVGPNWAALPLPAVIIDAEGRIAAMNDLAEPFLNMSARWVIGQRIEGAQVQKRLRIVPPPGPLLDRVRMGHDAITRTGVRFEIGDRAGGHDTRVATVHAGPVPNPEGAVMVLIAPTDGTDRLGKGFAVRQAARSAIGMAEMLAHEIKNPLAGIRGAAQLLAMNLNDEDREFSDLIVAEVRRIVSLLDQVEKFGDTSPPALASVNLHDVLDRARRSAGVGWAADTRIVAHYDPSLPPALADPDQLVQVCLNLLKNAAEALAREAAQTGRSDGTIRIRTFYDSTLRLAPTEDEPQGRQLPLHIEIEDDGPGLPPAIAEHIFEPFVSGRENGTGLGLALVSKIMTDHGGWISVESVPGRTIFRISLPKAS